MTPESPSNYPRALPAEETKAWIGDLIYGFLHLVQIVYGAFVTFGIATSYRDVSARNQWLVLLVPILLIVTVPVFGILRGRRWAMWSYLVLTLFGVLGAFATHVASFTLDAANLLQNGLLLSTLLYLPLRLSRRLGPAPR